MRILKDTIKHSTCTLVTHADATVHEEADERHEDAEERQEHPVLPQPGKRVPPRETAGRDELARALPTVLMQLLVALAVLLLSLAFKRLHFACLFFSVLTEVFGVTTIHLERNTRR